MMNKRWIFTHLLPIFLVVIIVAGITIAAVPSFKNKFVGYIKQFGPEAALLFKPTECTKIGSLEVQKQETKQDNNLQVLLTLTPKDAQGNPIDEVKCSGTVDMSFCGSSDHAFKQAIQPIAGHSNTLWNACSKYPYYYKNPKVPPPGSIRFGCRLQETDAECLTRQMTDFSTAEYDDIYFPETDYNKQLKADASVCKAAIDGYTPTDPNCTTTTINGSIPVETAYYYIIKYYKNPSDTEPTEVFNSGDETLGNLGYSANFSLDNEYFTFNSDPSGFEPAKNITFKKPGKYEITTYLQTFGTQDGFSYVAGNMVEVVVDSLNLSTKSDKETIEPLLDDNSNQEEATATITINYVDEDGKEISTDGQRTLIVEKTQLDSENKTTDDLGLEFTPSDSELNTNENGKLEFKVKTKKDTKEGTLKLKFKDKKNGVGSGEVEIKIEEPFEPIEGQIDPNIFCTEGQSALNQKAPIYVLKHLFGINNAYAESSFSCTPISDMIPDNSPLGDIKLTGKEIVIDIFGHKTIIVIPKIVQDAKKLEKKLEQLKSQFTVEKNEKIYIKTRWDFGGKSQILFNAPTNSTDFKNAKTIEDWNKIFTDIFEYDVLSNIKDQLKLKLIVDINGNKTTGYFTPEIHKLFDKETGKTSIKIILAFNGVITDKDQKKVGTVTLGYGDTNKINQYVLPYGTPEGVLLPKLDPKYGIIFTASFKIGPNPTDDTPSEKTKIVGEVGKLSSTQGAITLDSLKQQANLIIEIIKTHKDDETSEEQLARFMVPIQLEFKIDNVLAMAKLDGYYNVEDAKKAQEVFPNQNYSFASAIFTDEDFKNLWGDKYFIENYASYYPDYENHYLTVEESEYFSFDDKMYESAQVDFGAGNVSKDGNKIKIKMPSFLDYLKNKGDYFFTAKIDPQIPISENTVKQTAYIINENSESNNKISEKFAVLENDLWRKINGQVTFENGKPNDLGYVVGTIDRFNPQNPAFDYHATIDFSTEQCSQKGNQWVCNYSLEAPAKIINNQKATLALYPTKINENDPVSGLIGSQVIVWNESSLSEAVLNETTGELTANINTDAFTAFNTIIESSEKNQEDIIPKVIEPVPAPVIENKKTIITPIIEPVADLLKLPGIIMNDEKKPENLLGFAIDKTTKTVENAINTKAEEKIDLPENKKEEIAQINQTADEKSEEIKEELNIAVEKGPDNSLEVNDLLAKAFLNEVQRLDDIQNVIDNKSLTEKIKEFSQNLSSDITNFISKNTFSALNYAFEKLSSFYTNNLGFISNNIKSYFSWIYQHILFS